MYQNIVLLPAGATIHHPPAPIMSAEGLGHPLALTTFVNEC